MSGRIGKNVSAKHSCSLLVYLTLELYPLSSRLWTWEILCGESEMTAMTTQRPYISGLGLGPGHIHLPYRAILHNTIILLTIMHTIYVYILYTIYYILYTIYYIYTWSHSMHHTLSSRKQPVQLMLPHLPLP